MLQRRIFQFPPVIIVVAYGRLKPLLLKILNNHQLKVVAYERWSLTRGGCLQEVPPIVIENLKTFGILEKWSLTRGVRKGSFDCNHKVQSNLDYPDSSGPRLIVRIIENMNINEIEM